VVGVSGWVLAAAADVHASFVHGVVMPRAQENHVVEVGSAVSFPFVDVVGLAPCWVDAAAGCGAVLVADLECSAQAWWCGAVGASDVEHLPPAVPDHVGEPGPVRRPDTVGVGGVGDDGGEVGVAEDSGDRRRREQCLAHAGEAQGPADAVDEVVDVHGQSHVRSLRVLGPEDRTVEAAAGEVREGEGVEVVAAVLAAQGVGALLAGGLVLRAEGP
jgi:hypothetical protein